MPDEKELTIEEMKSLVSLSTLLPALLDKIASIEKKVADLNTSFTDIKSKFNNNTNAVIEYKRSVDRILENQMDAKKLTQELGAIKESVLRIETSISFTPSDASKKKTGVEVKVPKKKESTPEAPKKVDDKVIDIVDMILKEHKGRKTRTLTTIDIKRGFKCDDETAEKVLGWLEKQKMYNPKTHTLTFPKR